MKISAIFASTVMVCSLGVGAPVWAQQSTQEFSFSSQDGRSPPSTLRITEQALPTSAATTPVRDTPESLATYTRCRNNADREATGNAELHARITTCLSELAERRKP